MPSTCLRIWCYIFWFLLLFGSVWQFVEDVQTINSFADYYKNKIKMSQAAKNMCIERYYDEFIQFWQISTYIREGLIKKEV